ncbi:unnamed protein product [Trichogramma brassicae]|uniref:Uncharacterized protein n=1 Tax=Trichogramma brassicae TaxID=86971 RepID=A0A6H5J6M8_9HYME|nr:unnamed protein product [Trichogramma brassicae]
MSAGGFDGGPRSPTPSRRRSSSIAVARPTPDLHRFLQAEGGRPWGHLSPQPRSPSRTPSSVSPASQHLSPAGPCSPACPSPTSPSATTAAGASSRLPPRQRGRTSSMPAVPRHRVSKNSFVKIRMKFIKITATTKKNVYIFVNRAKERNVSPQLSVLCDAALIFLSRSRVPLVHAGIPYVRPYVYTFLRGFCRRARKVPALARGVARKKETE